MKQNEYLPEGKLSATSAVKEYISTPEGLERAMLDGIILEGRSFLCDNDQNLHVTVGMFSGIIPKDECVYSVGGDKAKDIAIISRVGKPVCFKIIDILHDQDSRPKLVLSRKAAQRDCMLFYLDKLCAGDIIDARVTHLEPFGAFVDIGCGIISLLSIDCMSVSRISHPKERFDAGQYIKVIIKTPADTYGRITLTHRELLGTWEENASLFTIGQTAAGIVRSIESYGVFVELTPNLAGLAELRSDIKVGQHAAVYIKNIIPEKMKIKLVVIDTYEGEKQPNIYTYPPMSHIDYWKYSPDISDKIIESVFLN
ncbi:MAG: S1 RNA-binding domain-containing protein [Eubacteriales bacterium]|nr:S1 RNA-binding domain-containing protein [Eubacteriales bacterium]